MTSRILFISLACLTNIFLSANANAHTHITFGVGVAPAPVVAEVVPPEGYMSCYVVPGSYYNQVWINEHSECSYYNTPAVWVSGHYECRYFDPMNGSCRQWTWIDSHWNTPPAYAYAGPVMAPPPPPVIVEGPPVMMGPPVVAGPSFVVGYSSGGHHHRHHHGCH